MNKEFDRQNAIDILVGDDMSDIENEIGRAHV